MLCAPQYFVVVNIVTQNTTLILKCCQVPQFVITMYPCTYIFLPLDTVMEFSALGFCNCLGI